MRRLRLSALLIGLIAVFALVAAGCGGSDNESGGSSSGNDQGGAPAKGKHPQAHLARPAIEALVEWASRDL